MSAAYDALPLGVSESFLMGARKSAALTRLEAERQANLTTFESQRQRERACRRTAPRGHVYVLSDEGMMKVCVGCGKVEPGSQRYG